MIAKSVGHREKWDQTSNNFRLTPEQSCRRVLGTSELARRKEYSFSIRGGSISLLPRKSKLECVLVCPRRRGNIVSRVSSDNRQGCKSISAVKYGTRALTVSLSDDKKTPIVRGLVATGVSAAPTPKDITFEYQDEHKATVSLDVVNFRVEPTPSAPAPAATKP